MQYENSGKLFGKDICRTMYQADRNATLAVWMKNADKNAKDQEFKNELE